MTLFTCFGAEKPVEVIDPPPSKSFKFPRLHRKRGKYSPHIEREKVFGRNCRTIDGWYFKKQSYRQPKPNPKVRKTSLDLYIFTTTPT